MFNFIKLDDGVNFSAKKEILALKKQVKTIKKLFFILLFINITLFIIGKI